MSSTNQSEIFILDDNFIFYFEKLMFGFWLITVPFYIILMYFLIEAQRKRVPDLSTPFFKLVIVAGIVDLVNLLNNYIFAVFPKWGWAHGFYMTLGRIFAYFYLYVAWANGINQAMCVSVMATNRLYAMMFPEKYYKAWHGNSLKLAYCLQFVIGCIVSSIVFGSDVIVEEGPNLSLVPKFTDKKRTNMFFLVGGMFLGVNSLYLIVAYCYLFIILRKRHQKQIERKTYGNAARVAKRREKRLFYMSSSVVIIQLMIILFFSTKLFPWFSLTTTQFYMVYNALSDVYSGANPYLLWIFSDVLRSYVLQNIGIKQVQVQITTTTSNHG